MTTSVTTIDIDMGLNRIIRDLIKDIGVEIGYWDGEVVHEPSGEDLAKIAIIHEFGCGEVSIIERSFFRTAFDENTDKINRHIEKLINGIVLGRLTMEQAIKKLAKFGMNLVKSKIDDSPNWAVGLKKSTIARRKRENKGSSNHPLKYTKFLRDNIKYKRIGRKWRLLEQ